MKNTFYIFNSLNLDLELFYAIRFNKGEIFLQGYYECSKIEELQKDGYIFTVDESGYINGRKIFNEDKIENNVTVKIILT